MDYLDPSLCDELMALDRHRCARLQQTIGDRRRKGQPTDRLLRSLIELVDRSGQTVEQRRLRVPAIRYPEELPVCAQRERIFAALRQHQVVIVSGETGSGKTTQLPKICLEAGLGLRGRIGHTQPRRLAAYSVAERIATELGTSSSQTVGYQVRFDERCGPETLIKLMTDGILLAEIQHDRYLRQYDALILDEAHERSLNIDFLLGYLKKLLPDRPELKLIVTSATIDVEAFSRHFDGAPVIEVSGRSYPVDVHYLPFDASTPENDAGLSQQLLSACESIQSLERAGQGHRGGDILAFLPGERDIRDCALLLRRAGPPDWDVLPLYARLGRAEQVRVFDLSKRRGRRVVLATNVAETSLTVPGIRYVIDSGLARVSRYSHRSRVQRLPIEPVAQANAEQRKGRCGRVGAGICVRLYSEEDFNNRPAYTDSEIQRTNLASVILQLTLMRFGDISDFPFLEAPDSGLVKDGYRLLEELGAIDDGRRLTPAGRALARIPVDPRVGRMLLAAGELGCLSEVLIIAAALSIQDPRERPLDKQQAADQAHARFRCASSDFMALVKLWHYFESQRQALSKSQLRKLCQREFLSVRRLFEWRDLHRQLLQVCRQLKLRPNTDAASESLVHRAVLTGFVSHLGQRDEQREYRGARNRRFHLFPGSYLSRKPPPWIVAAELVDTGKLYARTNGRIEAQWVIDTAPHLVRRSYAEPHYSSRHRAVMASESVSLFGLTLSQGRKVSYGAIDPERARELFIREALVAAQYGGKAPFWLHNRGLIEDIIGLETRLRRHDLLVDDELIYRFYDERLDRRIWSVAAFDKWRRRVERETPRLLFMERCQLLSRDPGAAVEQQFPDEMAVDGLSLALSYCFAPGKERDGVTVTIPLVVLKRLPGARFEWLVPGFLREKCIELVKALPKPLRKHFVPVPDCVDRALALMAAGNESLHQALGAALEQVKGVVVPLSAWQPEKLDPFYRMYFSVADDAGKEIAGGRDLAVLASQLQHEAESLVATLAPEVSEAVYQRWEFGSLEPSRQLAQGGLAVDVFPALIDRGNGVAMELRDERAEADAMTAEALARLCLLSLPQQAKYLKKQFQSGNRARLQLTGFFEFDALREDYLLAAFAHQFVQPGVVPRSSEDFNALLQERRGGLVASGRSYNDLIQQIIELHHGIQQRLAGLDDRVWAYALKDLRDQLAHLLFEHFLRRVAHDRLSHYPRYLSAIEYRLQRLAGHQQKDQASTAELQRHLRRLDAYCREQRSSPAGLLSTRYPELTRYRWLIEEYRVSLFAQGLGTSEPVSGKRLDRLWLDVTKIC